MSSDKIKFIFFLLLLLRKIKQARNSKGALRNRATLVFFCSDAKLNVKKIKKTDANKILGVVPSLTRAKVFHHGALAKPFYHVSMFIVIARIFSRDLVVTFFRTLAPDRRKGVRFPPPHSQRMRATELLQLFQ